MELKTLYPNINRQQRLVAIYIYDNELKQSSVGEISHSSKSCWKEMNIPKYKSDEHIDLANPRGEFQTSSDPVEVGALTQHFVTTGSLMTQVFYRIPLMIIIRRRITTVMT